MNDTDQLELEQLKGRQARLGLELAALGRQLVRLEERLKTPTQAAPAAAQEPAATSARQGLTAAPPPAPAVAPPPLSPIIPRRPVAAESQAPAGPVPSVSRPIPVPRSTEPSRPWPLPAAACAEATAAGEAGVPRSIPVPPSIAALGPAQAGPPPRQPAAPDNQGSLELRLGTYWLARLGVALVLTGLAFFGNYAYQKVIVNLGPGGKVGLLYLASAILLGAGAWWQRKAVKESLRNYAQVLFAGGLAAVYFTTYAAHHLEPLKIISSPMLDGALLLAWAGFMVWIADRWKSEVLALLGVMLAYYTSVITRAGSFTLYSNLVLSVAAVFFLARNRWATLTYLCLAGTYAAYGFWRFFNGSAWHWAEPQEGLWQGASFLMGYWLVFTAAVFLSRDAKFAGRNRAGFLTLNNGAFFTLFLLTMLLVRQGGFWEFALVYGAVLLVLAELAGHLLAAEPLARDFYLAQGLLLVTVGFITQFSGLQLALILAAESVMLQMAGQARKSVVLLTGACLAAGLSVGWGMDGLLRPDLRGLWLGVGLGGLMMANTLLAHHSTAASKEVLRPRAGYFTVLALAIWLAATWDNCSEHFPLVLAAEGLLLTLSIYLLRVREVSLLAQGYLVIAQGVWLYNVCEDAQTPPWWDPALLMGLTLGLSHWWQRQKVMVLRREIALAWQAAYAAAIIGVLCCWLGPRLEAPAWLVATSLLAVALTAYGVFTRAWFLAACAQFLLAVSAVQFAWQLSQTKPGWHLALLPIAALGALSFGTVRWFQLKPHTGEGARVPLLAIAQFYRWMALAMSFWWVCAYLPAQERMWVLALLGLLVFLWAGWRQNQETLLFSAAYTLAGMACFWLPLAEAPKVYWPNLLSLLALLGQQQIAKGLPDRYRLEGRWQAAIIVLGGLGLWRLLSLWVEETASGFYLTASWSVLALALFTCGLVLRERVYRWLSLGILAGALGRIVVLDVWKLETLSRILSFMALGVVLLVLGFVYSKYQEKIREWL
jgi:hypothetical protein